MWWTFKEVIRHDGAVLGQDLMPPRREEAMSDMTRPLTGEVLYRASSPRAHSLLRVISSTGALRTEGERDPTRTSALCYSHWSCVPNKLLSPR